MLIVLFVSFITKAQTTFISKFPYDYTWVDKQYFMEMLKVLPSEDEVLEMLNAKHTYDYDKVGLYLPYWKLKEGINVTDTVKRRLLCLLKNEWNYHEIRSRWYRFGSPREDTALLNLISRTASIYSATEEERAKRLIKVYDSIMEYRKISFENEIESNGVADEIIDYVAWIKMKEAIPVLQRALAVKDKRYNSLNVIKALARMGDTSCINKLYDAALNNWATDNAIPVGETSLIQALAFIGTQESIFKIHHLIDTLKCPHGIDEIVYRYCAAGRIQQLLRIIKNKDFLNILNEEERRDLTINEISVQKIVGIKKWLIDNKGNYEINRDYY